MSSAAGKTPAPGQAVYSASKFAVNGYFHSLRSEVCIIFFIILLIIGETPSYTSCIPKTRTYIET